MILDAQNTFDDANATIRGANTYASQNVIDLGPNARDIGSGENLFVHLNVPVAFAGGTSVKAQLIVSDAENMGSPTVIAETPTILEAALTLGAEFVFRIPPQLKSLGKRYMAMQYVGVGTHTLGSISARIVKDISDVKYYPRGYEQL